MYKTIFLLSSGLCLAIAPVTVQAQSFDTSGTASLSGQYLFRYVDFFNDENGNLTESCSLSGSMAFDGAGNYTLSNTQLFDSDGTKSTGACFSLGGGTYGVQSNGIAQLDNPVPYAPATLFGTFSKPVVIASSTEDDELRSLYRGSSAAGCVFEQQSLGRLHGGHPGLPECFRLAGAPGLLHFERRRQRKYRGIYGERLVSECELGRQP